MLKVPLLGWLAGGVNPKVSVIVPVWETPQRYLIEMLDSVLAQEYQNWELCIADGGSKKKHVRRVLEEYKGRDGRIKVAYLGKNLGIAGNTNKAAEMASGEVIAFLDHDDVITADALRRVAECFNGADIVYSDEDHLTLDGEYVHPHYKPDWNPDLLLSTNYICHFLAIRKSLFDIVGGLRDGFEGAQDYDLVLRCSEKAKKITHIPRILYHWRRAETSTAKSPDNKPYVIESGKKALRDALDRRGVKYREIVTAHQVGMYGIRYELAEKEMVSIIIPTKDFRNLLEPCVSSILKKSTYGNYEIIIVDNQSREKDTLDYLGKISKNPKVRVVRYPKPFNFSKINNFAAKNARGKYLLFLNNDTEVIAEDWLEAMVEHIQRDEVGAVGGKLLYPDDTIQHAGVIIGVGGFAGHAHRHIPNDQTGYFFRAHIIQDVSAVTAACLMVKRKVYDEVGGFNEKLAVAMNDVDLCLKIRERGHLIVYTPYAVLYHMESPSRGPDTNSKRFEGELKLMKELWGGKLESDPYYNPNLSYETGDYTPKKVEEEDVLYDRFKSWVKRKPPENSDFDWMQYLENYPELRKAGIVTEEHALRHYKRHGRYEDRTYKKVIAPKGFEWKTYLENYPDILASGIDNEREALLHWATRGAREGRTYKKRVVKQTRQCDAQRLRDLYMKGLGDWARPFARISAKLHKPKSVAIFGVGELAGEFRKRKVKTLEKTDYIKGGAKAPPYSVSYCIGVAEYAPEEKSEKIVENAASSAKTVVFAAATHGQGRKDCLNLQTHGWWVHKFARYGMEYDPGKTREFRKAMEKEKLHRFFVKNTLVFRRKPGLSG